VYNGPNGLATLNLGVVNKRARLAVLAQHDLKAGPLFDTGHNAVV